ncbi:hypothetical protein H2198_007618 [Neophaeococcomyces mojaviensis]|uniref:Uncharacterized protein n=1 Tax=Neophaeococcomyces mojaviensis TaxID=3383035 RepID=A0ACC2ZZF0_9EURO|nr:hypothetical protein H2198_007618 [Knufia sp. JES_112]
MSATRPDADRQSSSRPREKESRDPKPVKKQFCHEEGICWVCDKYGYHFDPKVVDKKETSKPTTSAPQSSSQPPRTTASKVKAEETQRPSTRRMSSSQNRSASMYATTPVHSPYPQYAPAPNAWPAATPPVAAYPSYYAPPPTPGYMPPQQFYYEPQPVFEEFPVAPPPQPKAVRRLSTANHERPVLERKPSRSSTFERTVSPDKRPQIVSHKSSRTIEADKMAMPPPPKPPHATVAVARPRPGRSSTYHLSSSTNRHSRYEEDDNDDDEDYYTQRSLTAYRDPPASPSRPPSSFRKSILQETPERPQMREKAKSYQDDTSTMMVASSSRQDHMPRRRTTESVPTSEQKEADAEAYMRKKGSTPVDLTAENLKTLKSHANRNVSDQRSESGSTASHVTHHSSSKDSSSGRGRTSSALGHAPKTSMNININGLSLNITDGGDDGQRRPPVKIDLGAMQISMNNRDKENIDYRKQPKQLERAPSMSSRPSRRSLTNGSLVSVNGQRRDREEMLAIEAPRETPLRTSYVEDDDEDHERELLEQLRRVSAKSSRQPSRATSNARGSDERPGRRETFSNRSSVEYSVRRDESVM